MQGILQKPKMERLKMAAAESRGYARPGYWASYSAKMATDGKKVSANISQRQARELAASNGYILPTAAEIYALIEHDNAHSQKLSLVPKGAFDNIFHNYGEEVVYFGEWTDTSLSKPKGRQPDYRKAESGKQYWLRVVAEGGKPLGEVWVPEGNDRVVREWSVFGVPAETEDWIPRKSEDYLKEGGHNSGDVHFQFDPDMEEASLIYRLVWHVSHNGCYELIAIPPSTANEQLSFRPFKANRKPYTPIR
jgi:hypothetical protein